MIQDKPYLDTTKASFASRIFKSEAEFTQAVDEYFEGCDDRCELYSEAGLCLYLSDHNSKKRLVSIVDLRNWYDGKANIQLQDTAKRAYMRIQNQIDTDPRYQEKGMVTRGIFLNKQARFGGYQDRQEQSHEATIRIVHGQDMDDSDFK